MQKKRISFVSTLIAIFVLQTTNAQWTQLGSDIDGEIADDRFGTSVSYSADGTTIAIGAQGNDGNGSWSGHVRVYRFISGSWVQQGSDIDGESSDDYSGMAVALSDDGLTVAIGAPGNDGNGLDAGHVRVFKFISGNWVQQGNDIDGEAAGDNFGWSVSLSNDGTMIAIGAPKNDGSANNSGHVRVYQLISGSWIQQGNNINGEAAADLSGESVSISGDGLTVAIGARLNDGNGSQSGHVRVYNFVSGSWIQLGLDIDGETSGDESGTSVSLSTNGLTLAVGAPKNDGNGSNSGHVRIFEFNSVNWIQVGNDIDGESFSDESGTSIDLSDDGLTVAIGAPQNDGGGSNVGHVRVFNYVSGSWTQQGIDLDGEFADDRSGSSVGLSGNGLKLAIGAPLNDQIGTDAGHVRAYKICIPTSSIDTQTACNSYTWINGTTYATSNNTATHTLLNAAGCDSVVTLNLTINPLPDDNVSLSGITITAAQSGATYQWLDCDGGFVPVPNETNQSFTPVANGNYAVEVTLNGCMSTSSCIALSTVGIDENDINSSLNIYPNPTSSVVTIECDFPTNIQVFSSEGKLIKMLYGKVKYEINLSDFECGVYYIRTEDGIVQKIIKN